MEEKHTEGEVFACYHDGRTPVLFPWVRLPGGCAGLQELSTERQNECSWRAGTKSTPALENFQRVGLENVCTAKQSFLGDCHCFPNLSMRAKTEFTRQRSGCPD